ncbi:MAG TPA: glycerophosphodiester phosphodiesterase family protein, partial [Kineosporiaceae bacterium]|nr:glycerophosphodiester phosphodiesterase family protein [Kineosporiaceae bacterium]
PRAPRSGRLLPDLLKGRPFSVAHRGGDADWPEMSLEGYRQSVALGVDALEISLARSSDGVWFGLHDDTLDRTSGTTGFVAARHSWAEISRYLITAHGTRDPGQQPRPYLRFEDLVAAYATTHTIFVDPKAADPRYHPELLRVMASAPAPADSFVAKSYCTAIAWARAARAQGLRTWGYYYGRDIDAGSTPPAATQAEWDLLGLDVAASPACWSLVRSYGKAVIAHVVADAASARRVIARGADGLMVSDVLAVLGSAALSSP